MLIPDLDGSSVSSSGSTVGYDNDDDSTITVSVYPSDEDSSQAEYPQSKKAVLTEIEHRLVGSSVSSSGSTVGYDDSDSTITSSVYPSDEDSSQAEYPQTKITVLTEIEHRIVVYSPFQSTSARHLIGQHRQRANLIRSACYDRDLLSSCEHTVYAGCFLDESSLTNRYCDMWGFWQDDEARVPPGVEPVVVAVEATAICPLDLRMHQEASEKASFDVCAPFVPGSNFVGIVHHCTRDATETYGLQAGTRVASIIQWGANARYVTVPPQHLITVPEDLDAADIASLISFYLPAFQALHHGRSRPTRYSFSCLRGKRVLVLADGATLEVQALVRLAKLAGASEVFVAVPREHHAVLKNRRIAALSDNPRDWLPVVQNSMDVVVDYSFPKHFSEVRQSLGPKGRLICSPQARRRGSGLLSFGCAPAIKLDFLLERYQLSMMKRANLFDFKEYVEQFRDFVFEDMTFLFSLLSTRKIRPQVDRFITLDYIPKAHQEIRSNVPQEGAIICEPWKK